MKIILASIFIFLYIGYSTFIIRLVLLTNKLNYRQKLFHILMILVIPFFWGVLVKVAISRDYEGTSSKQYRINKNKTKYKNHGGGAF